MTMQTIARPRTWPLEVSGDVERDPMAAAEWEASWKDWSEETFERPARTDRARSRRNHRRDNWK